MPERTFIHNETKSRSGLEAFKDRIKVMLEGHAAGYPV